MAIIDTLLGKAKNNNLFNLDNVSFRPNPDNLSFEPNLQNTSFTGNPDMTNFNADQPSLMQRLGNNISTGVNRGLGAIRNLDPMSGINDIRTGYQENVSTPFSVGNLQDTGKGLAQKFGELGGTLRRFADTGLGRGLITAGLVGATGGDASDMLGYGMQAGVTRQGLKTADQTYRKQLEDMGIDTSDIRGNITDDIFKNILAANYKNRKLDQDTYNKERTALQQMLISGNLSPQEYLAQINELNSEYARSLARTMGINSVGKSNQTRNADINAWLAPAKAEGYKGMAALRPLQGANIASQIDERNIDIEKKKNDLAIDQMIQEAMNVGGTGTPTSKTTGGTLKNGKSWRIVE